MNSQHLQVVQQELTSVLGQQLQKRQDELTIESFWFDGFSESQGWSDIDLKSGEESGEIIKAYLTRVLTLSYFAKYQGHCPAAKLAEQALHYWYRVNPINWNWWWNEIGKQRLLGTIALFLDEETQSDLIARIADDMPDSPTMTGANLADLCHGVAIGALLTKNESRFLKAIHGLLTTLETTNDEGIQADYSYQQHGAQIYNGGYGESFYNIALLWAVACNTSQFQFAHSDKQQLLNYFEHGTLWMTYGGQFDFNVCGRSVAKPFLEKPDYHRVLADHAFMLCKLFPQFRYRLSRAQHYFEQLAPYPYKGFKVFWRSDYSAYVSPKYAVSIKTNSCRTEPIEKGNQENLKGGWLGFGSMNISISGLEYQNIFPYWDWRFLPGVTAPEMIRVPQEWGAIEQDTDWAGGCGDGLSGVMSYELDIDGTKGLKSWFFFDGIVVALGAGLTSHSGKPLTTTINQSWLEQDVYMECPIPKCGEVNKVQWLHHGQCGYVINDEQSIEVQVDNRSENWHHINHHLNNQASKRSLLRLSIPHGVNPSSAQYAYTLLPGSDLAQTRAYVQNPEAKILVNQPYLQAVNVDNQFCAAFKQPNRLQFADEMWIQVDKPCVVHWVKKLAGWQVAVSTPGVSESIELHINDRYEAYTTQVRTPSDLEQIGKPVLFTLSSLGD